MYMKLILYFYILISTHLLNQYFDYTSFLGLSKNGNSSEGSSVVSGKQIEVCQDVRSWVHKSFSSDRL